jgi:lipopolysaccharide transport system permease protein
VTESTAEVTTSTSIGGRFFESEFWTAQAARSLFSHGALLFRVVRNEIAARYAGSMLGVAWSLIAPLLILAIYASFRVQRVAGMSGFGYVMLIFCGLVPFLATAEALSVGVTSVLADKALLTNTVFPIDLVPIKPVISSQLIMLVGMVVIIVGLASDHALTWTVGLLPLVWLGHAMALAGLNWILSLLNVVFRDLQNLIGAFLMIMLIASPIAYRPEMVPPQLHLLVTLNPFAHYVLAYQDVLALGQVPSKSEVAILVVLSLGTFALGSWFFPRAKRVLIDYV